LAGILFKRFSQNTAEQRKNNLSQATHPKEILTII